MCLIVVSPDCPPHSIHPDLLRVDGLFLLLIGSTALNPGKSTGKSAKFSSVCGNIIL
jgi:hypothetical protein